VCQVRGVMSDLGFREVTGDLSSKMTVKREAFISPWVGGGYQKKISTQIAVYSRGKRMGGVVELSLVQVWMELPTEEDEGAHP